MVLGWNWRDAPFVGREGSGWVGEWKVGRDTRSGGEGEDQAVLTSPTNLCVPPSRERVRGEAVGVLLLLWVKIMKGY